jgi:putative phage-type endonuclease
MDLMDELINLIDILLINNSDDVIKVEKIIINNPIYNKLDMDEQYIVTETIKEKHTKKTQKITVVEDIIKDTPLKNMLISSTNTFGYANKYEKSSYKKKEIEPTIFMKDKFGNTVTEGEVMSSRKKALILEKISQEEFDRRADIFNKIREIILPEQRSPEWFAMRSGKITASDGGAVLGENKHEPAYNFIMKKVFGSTFETNLACYHGKKFEQVVTMMYEYINDVHTEEFGLLGHPDYYFLGASPDGICAPYCRDKKTPNPLVGRMLEIKCPLMRKIKYSGDIKDTICPIYYWCQVQLQLECCNLDECDFIQCNIEEYCSREEWINDTDTTCDYKSKKYGLERGVLIELIPTKLSDDDYIDDCVKAELVYDKASFLYPPKIDMSINELDNWILTQISELKPTLKVHRIIYWRLIESNCTLILRDREWFNNKLDTLRTMWGYVEFLRNNEDVANEWKTWINNLPKKYNEKIIDKLIELINKKKNISTTITIDTSGNNDVQNTVIKKKKVKENKNNTEIIINETKNEENINDFEEEIILPDIKRPIRSKKLK